MHWKMNLVWAVLVMGLVGGVVGCGKPASPSKGPGHVPPNTTDSK